MRCTVKYIAYIFSAVVLFSARPSPAQCPALDLRAPVHWAGTPWSADASLLCDLYTARDALAAVRAEQRRGRAAGECTRAVRIEGGTIAPCTVEGLPPSALQALLEDHAALALTRAEWAAERTARGADVLALRTRAEDAERRWREAEARAAEPVVVTRAPPHWTAPRVVAVIAAGVVAAAAGMPCARGEAGWCAVSGLSAGLGLGLAF